MRTYLRNLVENISQSLWLMPAVSIAMAFVASYLMLEWEEDLESNWKDIPLVYRSGRDASLAIVGTIVGSLMTVAGVIFSITIVSLTLASSQFGPRLLRNFLRSRASQVTLGALIGSFVYGILIMTGMDDSWKSGDAHPSVTLMIALACFCVCLIVYYIHHVATSIQADGLVASVYRELENEIDRLPLRKTGQSVPSDEPLQWGNRSFEFSGPSSGYVAAIDCEGLSERAEELGVKVQLLRRPGQFVARQEALAYGFGKLEEDDFRKALDEAIFIKEKRTPEQDLEFLFDQLVEVALRAISPGINDPNTAIVCIDYLGAALQQLANRELPRRCSCGGDNAVNLFVPFTDYGGFVAEVFDQLRQSGRSYPEIVIRLLSSLCRLSASMEGEDPRQTALERQFDQLEEAFRANDTLTSKDRSDIEERLKRFRTIRKAGA